MSIEDKIGYQFKDKTLIKTAMSHTSYANEGKGRTSNERLEFLGDAILELIASDYIFKTYPKMPEGEMTKTRAYAVCEDSLAIVANRFGFSDFLLVGKCENRINEKYRNSILADSVEATIGAIYIDSGLEKAREFILPNIIPQIEDYIAHGGKDYKTRLQEKLQEHGDVKIEYLLIGERGPDHAKIFDVQVKCNGKVLGQGEGRSKKEAEMDAAKNALGVK
ncbi:MAG: ribonuclease III [Clostridia bacterium]|nr:ribonuclease III [Clostridia bacterium]